MTLQYLCHLVTALALCASAAAEEPSPGQSPAHNYPTVARVEYVNACMEKADGKMAALYQCACAIDRIANALSYDEFVEAATFAKYATLPGEGGGEFRDFERARQLAKRYRDLERNSLKACGMAL
jgi:hypothetical protein